MVGTARTSDRTEDPETRDARSRILEAAAGLTREGGIAALTTRAVAAAASVQAPTFSGSAYRASAPPASGMDARSDAKHGLPKLRLSVTGKPHPSYKDGKRVNWQPR